tara:strand:+ start:1959 stop:3044 length:1086 start_codon:yes stop_codon:yes gene_type:complete
MNEKFAEYIWLDGAVPTKTLRSKTRIIEVKEEVSLDSFPDWGFDGSSTNQASGDNSDCILRPVSFVKDPLRGEGNFLVMCEVFDREGNPHSTNSRSILRQVLQAGAAEQDPLFGFEQEYTLFQDEQPLGWPKNGFPEPQGPFYCGVGAGRVNGRQLVEAHQKACVDAGLLFYGVNAEVMLGQWEFQIGYRGFDEPADALLTTDHLWFANWLLQRLGEDYGISVSYENKPIKGDWNGAGCHTNFSTKDMRNKNVGKQAVERAILNLEKNHQDHVNVYGHALDERLTGDHETCSINQFKSGESDRGASIRIPIATSEKGYGYLEDRRPGANSDPYLVAARILTSVCELDSSLMKVSSKELTKS